MRPQRPLVEIFGLIGILALAFCAHGQFEPVDPYQASVRLLRAALTPQRDDSHSLQIGALRELRDPQLQPVFNAIAPQRDAAMQAHAALGLAAIRTPPGIDADTIRSLVSPGARMIVIENTLRDDLLSVEQMQTLLAWDQLEPVPAVRIAATLVADDKQVDAAVLERLSSHADLDVAALATWLLAETGKPQAIDAYLARLHGLSASARTEHLTTILPAIAEFRIASARSWVESLLNTESFDEEVAVLATWALLRLDPKAAVPAIQKLLSRDESQASQLRCALMLLELEPPPPPAAFDRLAKDDPLISLLTQLGRALADRSDARSSMIALIDLDHRRASRAIIGVMDRIPADQAIDVYIHIIKRVNESSRNQTDRVDLAIAATQRLAKLDRAQLESLLSEIEDDSLAQEAILVGLLGSDRAGSAELARSVKRIGFSRADSLALLLLARSAEQLNTEELEALSRLAAGGGRISRPLATQAAWLYLKHSGQLDRSLKEILADS